MKIIEQYTKISLKHRIMLSAVNKVPCFNDIGVYL